MHSVLNAIKLTDMVHKHHKWQLYTDCSELELFYCGTINLAMAFSNHLPPHTQMTTKICVVLRHQLTSVLMIYMFSNISSSLVFEAIVKLSVWEYKLQQ